MTTAPPADEAATLPPRERILRAASDLFYKHGIRSVGVDAIVEHSGVAKATLYKHFPSKDGLVAEVLRRSDSGWRRWFEAEVRGRAQHPAERLLVIYDVLADWFADPLFRGSPFINVRIELASDEHPAVEAATEHVARVRAFLAGMAREAGAPDPDTLAAQLQQLMKGAIVMALEHEPRASELARLSAETLLAAHGVARPARPRAAR